MSSKSSAAEILFLKIFKFVVLFVMGLALLVTVGALGFAAYQWGQSPKEPTPAQKAPASSVNVDDFLKGLDPAPKAQKQPEQQTDDNAQDPIKEPAPVKYKTEVSQVYGCYVDSSQKARMEGVVATEESVERLRAAIQRIADSEDHDRGQPYVTDMVKVTCAIVLHPKVIERLTRDQDRDLFYNALNFHLKAWDTLRSEARAFEEEEEARVQREINDEESRVASAKQQALFILMIAGGAFALFMALALYLIISAMESSLRRMSESLEKMPPSA